MKNNRTYRYSFRLTEDENRRFIELAIMAGCANNKSRFILACLFGRPLKVVKVDAGAMKYYARLNDMINQFVRFGNNYNQSVHILRTHLNRDIDKKIDELIRTAKTMKALSEMMVKLTMKFEQSWLHK